MLLIIVTLANWFKLKSLTFSVASLEISDFNSNHEQLLGMYSGIKGLLI